MSGQGTIQLNPSFDLIRNAVSFNTDELNYLLSAAVFDNASVYQRLYGVYSYMQLTKNLKHKIHYMSGHPLVWQAYKSCKLTPVGVVRMSTNEVTPCAGVAITEQCNDEFLGSCFEEMNEWNGGSFQLSDKGRDFLAKQTQVIANTFTEGAVDMLAAGQLYNLDTVVFKPNVSQELQDAFKKSVNTCQGWIKMLQVGGEGEFPHWNIPGLISADNFTSNGTYTGDIVALMDSVRNNAPAKLKRIVDQGIATMGGSVVRPIYKLTSGLFSAFAAAKRTQDAQPLSNQARITTEMADGLMLYFLDGVPVIPVHETGGFEQYIEGCTEMVYLTATGNINLGASFADLPSVGSSNVGIMVWMDMEPKNLGNVQMRSDSLFSSAISNADLIVGTQEFIIPN